MSKRSRNVFVVNEISTVNKNLQYPPIQEQVLDLRTSSVKEPPKPFSENSTHPQVQTFPHPHCLWCDKPCIPGETSFDEAFCSDVCFNQYRRQSFKKRSLCMWCNGFTPGVFDSPLDETKFCSHQCLTQYKLKLFCDETSAHLGHIAETNHQQGAFLDSQVNQGEKDLITPDLWLKFTKSSSTLRPNENEKDEMKLNHSIQSQVPKCSSSSPVVYQLKGNLKKDRTKLRRKFIPNDLRRISEVKRGEWKNQKILDEEEGHFENLTADFPHVQQGRSPPTESSKNCIKDECEVKASTTTSCQNDPVISSPLPLTDPDENKKKEESYPLNLFPRVPPVTVLVPFAIPFPIPIPIPIFINKQIEQVVEHK